MPVLAELRAVAVKRTAMQTRHEPFDHYPRDEIEIADSRQDLGRTRGVRQSRSGHRLEKPSDNLLGIDAVRLGLKIQQHTVAQHRQSHRADILRRRDAAAIEQRTRLGAEHQRLAGARAGAPFHPLPHAGGTRSSAAPAGRLALTMRSA